ncbi:MAG: FMN-binding protein [Spirochaetaceae bacterium]|jgi:fumarate reductase flavoprotein subunit|nr:FMN-binding protein [Spirochaetaceae bacterium]
MKKYIALFAGAALLFAACLSLKSLAVYEPGSWEGIGEGYNGTIHLIVDTDSTSIIDITILEHNDDAMIGGEAISELKEFILETDSTDIDAISGATQTSEGFINAVNEALSKARIVKE